MGSFFRMPSMFWLIYCLANLKASWMLFTSIHVILHIITKPDLFLFTQRFSWVFNGNWHKIPRDKKLGKETVLGSVSEALRHVPCCKSLVVAEKRRLNSWWSTEMNIYEFHMLFIFFIFLRMSFTKNRVLPSNLDIGWARMYWRWPVWFVVVYQYE